jgi:hypothetical protein
MHADLIKFKKNYSVRVRDCILVFTVNFKIYSFFIYSLFQYFALLKYLT